MASVFGNVQESSYFRKENQEAMMRRLAKLTGESHVELPEQASLQGISRSVSDVPTTIVNQRPEFVYNHVKGTYSKSQFSGHYGWRCRQLPVKDACNVTRSLLFDMVCNTVGILRNLVVSAVSFCRAKRLCCYKSMEVGHTD